jgi:hypothetical protein
VAQNFDYPGGLLPSNGMGLEAELADVERQMRSSLAAARAAAVEAGVVLGSNPGIDGARLAEAMGEFLTTQAELFDAFQALLHTASSPPTGQEVEPSATGDVEVNTIGEFPDDWGHPRDWVDAPRRIFRRRGAKSATPAPQQS